MDSNIKSVLYRIVQECVNNVLKHSKAHKLDISLIKDEDGINITIEDDGCGFDADPVERQQGHHFGLRGMRDRTERSGGKFRLDTAPGKGVSIEVQSPRKKT